MFLKDSTLYRGSQILSIHLVPSSYTGWEANGVAAEALLKWWWRRTKGTASLTPLWSPAVLINVLINLPHISSLAVRPEHLLAVTEAPWAFAVSENGCNQEARMFTKKLWKFSEWEQCCVRILQAKHLSSKAQSRLFCWKLCLFPHVNLSSDNSWLQAPGQTLDILSKECSHWVLSQCKQDSTPRPAVPTLGQRFWGWSAEQYFTLCKGPLGSSAK